MRRTHTNSRGFTIVELITVVAVIGILASIGIISWSGARNRAERESYSTNAQQVKLKLGEYYTDNNRYHASKAEVVAYLNDVGSTTLGTEFSKSEYSYVPSPGGCATSGGTACSTYTITVSASNWSNAGGDVVVTPQ